LHYSPYLASNLKNAKLRLDKGGVMVFSVQKSHDQDCTFNDKMSNYCFSKNYIEEIAKEAGYLHCNISEDIILEGETSLQVILR
jgi:predicted TPR repeat methyltransferase